jgi:hypothetical protein
MAVQPMFRPMSTDAHALLEKFITLPRAEQLSVYEAIARTVGPVDYGPLSDDELTAIAAQTFALLDEEDTRAQSR